MLDQLRQQIQTHLDELLGEADKLRHALAAPGTTDAGGGRRVQRFGRGYFRTSGEFLLILGF